VVSVLIGDDLTQVLAEKFNPLHAQNEQLWKIFKCFSVTIRKLKKKFNIDNAEHSEKTA
jgi:hypothetical protein